MLNRESEYARPRIFFGNQKEDECIRIDVSWSQFGKFLYREKQRTGVGSTRLRTSKIACRMFKIFTPPLEKVEIGRAGYGCRKSRLARNGKLECDDYGSRTASLYRARLTLQKTFEVGFGRAALLMNSDMKKSMDERALWNRESITCFSIQNCSCWLVRRRRYRKTRGCPNDDAGSKILCGAVNWTYEGSGPNQSRIAYVEIDVWKRHSERVIGKSVCVLMECW